MRHKSLCVVVACLVAVAAAASGPADGASTSGDSNKATTNTVHLNAAASRAAVRQPIRSSRQSGAHQQGAARREPLGNSTSADALHTHAASAMRMQPASSAGLHSSRHMVILSTIHPVKAPQQQHSTNQSHAADTDQQKDTAGPQQQRRQRSYIKARASIFRIASTAARTPRATASAGKHEQTATAVVRYTSSPGSPAAETPKPLHIAVLLPMQPNPSYSSSTATAADVGAATARFRESPLLLTVHVEQRVGGQAYLWTDSQLIHPGSTSVSLQANMSDYTHSWPIQLTAQPSTGAAPAPATPPAATAVNSTQAGAAGTTPTGSNSTQLNDLSIPNEPKTTANDTFNEQTACRFEGSMDQPEQQQQLGPSVPTAASTCPALQQHLPTCAATDAAGTAYAVASMLERNPAQAAWIAATLAQNEQAHQLLSKQQSQSSYRGRPSSSSGRSSNDSRGNVQVCQAWPAEYDLALLISNTSADVTAVPTAAAAEDPAMLQDNNSSSSSSTALWAAVGPYLEPYMTLDSRTQSVVIHAALEQVLLFLAALLLATAAAAALLCRSSSSRSAGFVAAAIPTAAHVNDIMLSQQQQMVHDSYPHSKRHSSRLSNRDQGRDDTDLLLFGRSALEQLEQQQQQDSLADVDQDDYMFGYTGAPAAAAAAAATAGRGENPSVTGASAVVRAVRKASAAAAGQAAGALRAALGTKAAAAADRSLFSPSGVVRPNDAAAAAAAVPGTAAKLAAEYWDSVDEEAVNKLPANIQEHLQAGGKWTRDNGGRLIRGSIKAFRAVSNRAAAAVAAALSGGAVGQQQQQQQGGSEGSKDAGNGDLLMRLMAAGPGTEIALSDDDM